MEACQSAMMLVGQAASAIWVGLYLYGKKGNLRLVASTGPVARELVPPEIDQSDPSVRLVLGSSTPAGERGQPRVYADGTGSFADLPLHGPNRTIGFLRLALPSGSSSGPQVFLDQAAAAAGLMISGFRRRLELDALNSLRELLSRPYPELNKLFAAVTDSLVEPWTEFSIAIVRARGKDGRVRVASASTADGIECPVGDMEPRNVGEGIVGRVLETGEPIFEPSLKSSTLEFRDLEWIERHKLGAFACLPIHRGSKAVGTLSVFVAFPYTFYESKRRFLRNLCDQVGTALTVARLVRGREQTDELARTLVKRGVRAPHVLSVAIQDACELLEANSGFIAVASKSARTLSPISTSRDLLPETIPPLQIDGPSLTASVFSTRLPINCPDVQSAEMKGRFLDFFPPKNGTIRSELLVPMIYENQVIGVMAAESSIPNYFGQDDQDLLSNAANQATIVYQRHRMYDAADELARTKFDSSDRETLHEQIVAAAAKISGAEDVALYLGDPRTELLCAAVSGSTAENARALRAEKLSHDHPFRQAVTRLEAMEFPSRIVNRALGIRGRTGFGSALILPLYQEPSMKGQASDCLGVLAILPTRPYTFFGGELTLLKALAGVAALSLADCLNRETLQAAYSRAEMSARFVGVAEIAAGMAHDVRNVLHRAAGAYSAIDDEIIARLGESRESDEFRKIGKALTEMTFYFDRIREYARFQEPRFENRLLADVVNQALELLGHSLREKHIKIRKDYRSTPLIRIDVEHITRAITNVVMNALYAMKDRGSLHVAIDMHTERHVRLRISDDGTGIPDELLPRVFEPYFSTKPTMGTGMGLPSVKSVVEELHDGLVNIESKRGRGTTVEFLLPNRRVEDEESHE